MHCIKWVVHVCKSQWNKWCRERTPREMSREAIFFGFHKKKVTFAKSYPKWPVARVISHLTNSDLSFMSYHLKTTSSPQCFQMFVSDPLWPFHVVQMSHTSDLGTMMPFTRMASLKQYKDYTSNGHTALSADRRESLKQECPSERILDQTARPFRVKNGLQGHCKST